MVPVVRTVLALSVAMALLAYVMRPRFPDTASNHGLKTAAWAYFGFVNFAASTAQLLGCGWVNVTRALFDAQLLLDKKVDTVEEYTTEMDGVEVTIYKPVGESDGLRPGIINYHGGGWVLMSPALYSPVYRSIVDHTKSILVAVNYRRAPEHLFPIPLEDCLKATKYFMRNAEKYGVDPNRIGVKGDSAGGNLAMAAALRLAKDADPTLPTFKFMSLDYPALQAFDFDLPCYKKYEHGPGFLNKAIMIKYWLAYAFGHRDYFNQFYSNNHTSPALKAKYKDNLSWDYLPKEFTDGYTPDGQADHKGDKELSEKIQGIILDPSFAPLMAPDEDLSLLPPAYIMNAEFDVLRDEGFIAAERLRQAGVEVEQSHLPAEEHGFLNLVAIDQNAENEIKNFAKFFARIMK